MEISNVMKSQEVDFKTAFSNYSNSVEVVHLITEFKNMKKTKFSDSVNFFRNQFWTIKSFLFAWIVWAFFTTLSLQVDLQKVTFFGGFTFIVGFVFYKFQDKKGRFLMREMNIHYVLLLGFLIGLDFLISKMEVIDEIISLVWMLYLLVIRNYFLTFNHLKKQIYVPKVS
jgi:hypothetical protein